MEKPENVHPTLPTSVGEIFRSNMAQTVQNTEQDNMRFPDPLHQSWTINMPFLVYQVPVERFYSNLHDIWYSYYLFGKKIPAESALMDKLAFQLLQVEKQGVLLSRRTGADDATEVAMTSDGSIWTDLPFFASDMMSYWTKDCATMGCLQRINLLRFLGKLTSIGLVNDKLSLIALAAFRDTLETPRSLGKLNSSDDEDASRKMEDLSIGDLLPTLLSWTKEVRTRLIRLSHESRSDMVGDNQGIGELYCDDTVASLKLPGFSSERWLFWLHRLDAIHDEATEAGKKDLAECAASIMHQMLFALALNDSDIKRAYDANPDMIKYRSRTADFLRHGPKEN